jgi:hypothetical protein
VVTANRCTSGKLLGVGEGLLPAGRSGRADPTWVCLNVAQQTEDRVANTFEIRSTGNQHLCRNALTFTDEPQQDVLRADVVVAELQRLAQRELEHLLGTRRERNVAGRAADPPSPMVRTTSVRSSPSDIPSATERLSRQALASRISRAEGARYRCGVIEPPRFFLGEDDRLASPIGESFEHE